MFGRVDVGAVAAELGEAGVVEQDHHDVRRVAPGVGRLVEPRLGLGDRAADPPLEPRCSRHGHAPSGER